MSEFTLSLVSTRTSALDAVARVLEFTPRLASVKHPNGWRPLHVAVMSGDADLVKYILGLSGVEISSRDESTIVDAQSPERLAEFHARLAGMDTNNATALHFACFTGNWDVMKVLIDHGASFEATDCNNRLPDEYFDMRTVEKEVTRLYSEAYKSWKATQEKLEPRKLIKSPR